MRSSSFLSFLGSMVMLAMTAATPMLSQVYPLSENNWRNPDFVERFTGSYGILSDREPKITEAEALIFQQVAELMQTNQVAASIEAIRVGITPESSAALEYTLANLFLQSNQEADAIRYYEAAIRKFPNFLRAYKNLGLAEIQRSNYARGLEMLTQAVELGDQSGLTFGLLAFCHLNLGDPLAALDAYRIATVMMPGNKDWEVGRAHALSLTGEHQQAETAFRKLFVEDPTNRQYLMSVVNANLGLDRSVDAGYYLEVLRRLGMAEGSSLSLLGDIYLNENLPQLAAGAYLESLTVKRPIDGDRGLQITRNLLNRGATNESKEFIAAFREHKTDLSSEVELALLNFEAELALSERRDADAAAILEEVVERDPTNGRAFLLLANYYAGLEDYAEATYAYERAQAVEATRYDALIQHARLLVRQSDLEGALDLLADAQSIRTRSNVTRFVDAIQRALDAQR